MLTERVDYKFEGGVRVCVCTLVCMPRVCRLLIFLLWMHHCEGVWQTMTVASNGTVYAVGELDHTLLTISTHDAGVHMALPLQLDLVDVVLDGTGMQLLASTATAIYQLTGLPKDLSSLASSSSSTWTQTLVAGSAFRGPFPRDGPSRYARFVRILQLAASRDNVAVCEPTSVRVWARPVDAVCTLVRNVTAVSVSIGCDGCRDGVDYVAAMVSNLGFLTLASVSRCTPQYIDLCSLVGVCTAGLVQLVDYAEHSQLLLYVTSVDGVLMRVSMPYTALVPHEGGGDPIKVGVFAGGGYAFSGRHAVRLLAADGLLAMIDLAQERYVSQPLALGTCLPRRHLLEDPRICVVVPLGAYIDTTGRLTMCPYGTTTLAAGSQTIASCVRCPDGTVLKGVVCAACPLNHTCAGAAPASTTNRDYVSTMWGDAVLFDVLALPLRPTSIALRDDGMIYVATVAPILVQVDSTRAGSVGSAVSVPDAFDVLAYDIHLAQLWAACGDTLWLLNPDGWGSTRVGTIPDTTIKGVVTYAWECYGSGVFVVVEPRAGGCALWWYTESAFFDLNRTLDGSCSSARAVAVTPTCTLCWLHNDTIWRWDSAWELRDSVAAPPGSVYVMASGDSDGRMFVGTAATLYTFSSGAAALYGVVAGWSAGTPILAHRGSSNSTGLFAFAIDAGKVAVVGLWIPPRAVCPTGYSPAPGGGECQPCVNAVAAGTQRCSACAGNQYLLQGACVACPRVRWWPAVNDSSQAMCPIFIDAAADEVQVGLAMADVGREAAASVQAGWVFDYFQPFVLGAGEAATRGIVGLVDDYQGRFWRRVEPLTPAPVQPVQPVHATQPTFQIPGLWVACSRPVARTSACTCRIQGRMVLPEPWASMRREGIPLMGPDSIYITRTDAASTYPVLISRALGTSSSAGFEYTVNAPMATWTQVSADVYDGATCVAGWPATYACASGFSWRAPNSEHPGGACIASETVPFTISLLCPGALSLVYPSATYCVSCPWGTVPSTDHCEPCADGTYQNLLQRGACVAKRVLSTNCTAMFVAMGPSSDDACLATGGDCANLATYSSVLYCLRLSALAGYSLISFTAHDSRLLYSHWYMSCGSSPPFSTWTTGSRADACYYQCLYGVLPWAPFSSVGVYVWSADADGRGYCAPCARDACASGLARPLSSVRVGCGPATYPTSPTPSANTSSDDGCVSMCPPIPLGAAFREAADDPCAWVCTDGYIQLNGICVRCAGTICAKGEAYVGVRCGPSAKLSDVCAACVPPVALSTIVDLEASMPGVCGYQCADGWVSDALSTAFVPVCLACSTSATLTCPQGQSRVCSRSAACVPCTLPLPVAGISLPSQTPSCNITCQPGYVLVSNGLTVRPPALLTTNTRCDACSLWPNSTCIGALCPSGQYALAGGGCVSCPSATSCAAGFYMTGCLYGLTPPVCVSCPAEYLLESDPALGTTRQWVHLLQLQAVPPFARPQPPPGYGTCLPVCVAHHMYDGMRCTPCPRSLYAFWNASAGTRWWDVSLDSSYPWLPTIRKQPEQRAGRCWPCPAWSTSVFDLCDTNISVADTGAVLVADVRVSSIQDGGQIRPRLLRTPVSSVQAVSGVRRRLLLLSHAGAASEACTLPGLYQVGRAERRTHRRKMILCGKCPLGSTCLDGVRTPAMANVGKEPRAVQGCPDGFARSVVVGRDHSHSSVCEPCRSGYYGSHGTCHACPSRFVSEASLGSTHCRCTRGDDDLCAACPHRRHVYSDIAGSCMMCPQHQQPAPYVHHRPKTSLASRCVCSAGSHPASFDDCVPCPLGTYKGHVGDAACTYCAAGYTTLHTGAVSAWQCTVRVA